MLPSVAVCRSQSISIWVCHGIYMSAKTWQKRSLREQFPIRYRSTVSPPRNSCRMFYQMFLIEYPSFDIKLYCKEIRKKLLTHTVLVTKESFLHDQKKLDEERRCSVLST